MKNENETEFFCVTDEMLSELRERIKPYLTEKRYAHTLAVEREVSRLADIYLPEKKGELRCAALLHDITKILSFENQLQYCEKFDIIVRNSDKMSPKIFHAKTGAAVAAADFPEFVNAEIISGIRWHTTGRAGMTLFESLVYLADYIEETRTFDDCVELREFFYDGLAGGRITKEELLVTTMIKSFDMTIRMLIEEGSLIDSDTVEARNYFVKVSCEKKENL